MRFEFWELLLGGGPRRAQGVPNPGVGVGKVGQMAWVGAKVCNGRMGGGLSKGQAAHKQRNNISRMGVDSPVVL